ncbi:hypothetical protein BXA22_16835 [Edwardsiella piscicida]|nr:hypothetical protein BXA22_16835 [Edwardsiella piscicida]
MARERGAQKAKRRGVISHQSQSIADAKYVVPLTNGAVLLSLDRAVGFLNNAAFFQRRVSV